jgi:hypothetical protein
MGVVDCEFGRLRAGRGNKRRANDEQCGPSASEHSPISLTTDVDGDPDETTVPAQSHILRMTVGSPQSVAIATSGARFGRRLLVGDLFSDTFSCNRRDQRNGGPRRSSPFAAR